MIKLICDFIILKQILSGYIQLESARIIYVYQQLNKMKQFELIRRKIEHSRKKSIFRDELFKNVNQDTIRTTQQIKNQPKKLTIFPLVSEYSPNQQFRAQTHQTSIRNIFWLNQKFHAKSIFLKENSMRRRKYCLEPIEGQAGFTSTSVGMTIRINQATSQKGRSIKTDRSYCCYLKDKTPKRVFILNEPKYLGNVKQWKREAHTFAIDTVRTDQKLSPNRKYSISGWKTSEDISSQ